MPAIQVQGLAQPAVEGAIRPWEPLLLLVLLLLLLLLRKAQKFLLLQAAAVPLVLPLLLEVQTRS